MMPATVLFALLLLPIFAIDARATTESRTIVLRPGEEYTYAVDLLGGYQYIVNYTMTVRPDPANYSAIDVYFLNGDGYDSYRSGGSFKYDHSLTVLNTTGAARSAKFSSAGYYRLVFDNTDAGTPSHSNVTLEYSVTVKEDYSQQAERVKAVAAGGALLMVFPTLVLLGFMIALDRKDRARRHSPAPSPKAKPAPANIGVLEGLWTCIKIFTFLAIANICFLFIWLFNWNASSTLSRPDQEAFHLVAANLLYIAWVFSWVYLPLSGRFREKDASPRAFAAGMGAVLGGIIAQPLLRSWAYSLPDESSYPAFSHAWDFMVANGLCSITVALLFFLLSGLEYLRGRWKFGHRNVLKVLLVYVMAASFIFFMFINLSGNAALTILFAPIYVASILLIYYLFHRAVRKRKEWTVRPSEP